MRSPIAILLAALLGVLIYVGNFAWWFDREVVHPEDFVDSAVVALGREDSREAMSRLIVVRFLDEYPFLIVVESNLVGMFSDLLTTPALGEVARFVAADVHEAIVTGNQDAIVIDLANYRDVIMAPLEAVAPRLADLVPDGWFFSIEVIEAGALPDLSLYAQWISTVLFMAIVGAVALTAFLLWFVKRRGVGVALVGVAFMLSGFASALLVPGGRWLTIRKVDRQSVEVLVTNTYNEFTRSLLLSAAVLVLIGLGLVAIGIAMWSAHEDDESPSPVAG
ncbi:MAG: hypothetical protein ACC683_02190 [Acidimicrobiia bacterium]